MSNLLLVCWYLWEGLPTLYAFPVDSTEHLGTRESWSSYWEYKWPRYAIGTLGFVVVALTLAGCLCCRRQRRPKGFQDDAGNGKEFKDGSTAGTETTIERVPSASLELEVPRLASSHSAGSKVQFEALPIERLVGEARVVGKPKPPSPSLFSEERETEKRNFLREQPCREWFDAGNCHVPRERLKYLREIGRGWFGKVVEGTTESPANSGKKNRGVVVRILTEEATTREKAWFLGEATPYLKLDHPNILTLLGCCLEIDPYLLLFESCPAGDLKGFLRGNRDKGTCEALRKENVPKRMALDIANALEHMHENGFAHTDLSARNCLVAPDLSAKLGDYGTGVEKYPGDYYVVGDRALPIRWSAPESLDCTETTIETRAITPRANLWSYAVLLWEMATWGERPYNDLGDEQVIEMVFSVKSGFFARGTSDALLKRLRDEFDAPRNFCEAVEASWKYLPEERASLKESKEILCGKRIEDFEKRWENLKPNGGNAARERDNRSASLQDLRGSVDSELWQSSSTEEKNPLQAQFRLGPEEPVKNLASAQHSCLEESGSETEEESWRGRVERGAYTEKVKQKSKSVADLMVLVHIDSDSEAEISLGPQISEKTQKKRLPASGSDGDLRSHFLADEFDEAIRKLREPSICNDTIVKTTKNHCENFQIVDNIEKPKLMTLTHQGQTPILRLCFETPENVETSVGEVENSGNRIAAINTCENAILGSSGDDKASKSINTFSSRDKLPIGGLEENNSSGSRQTSTEIARIEGPVLRLVSKGDPDLPLLRYDVPERTSTSKEAPKTEEISRFDSLLVFEAPDSSIAGFSNNFKASPSREDPRGVEETSVDVELWNNALAYELEKKNPGYDAHATIFDESLDCSRDNAKEPPKRSASAPNTPKSVNFSITESVGKDLSSSAPESPRKNDLEPKIEDKSSRDVNYYQNLSVGSSSAPETPRKHYFELEIDEKSAKDVNYYQNLRTDSSSAPETPRKHYFEPEIEEKSSKDANYYQDSIGSAPETPQFRGNYALGQLDEDSSTCEELEASERMLKGSAPDTPQSRGNYSVGNGDEDSFTGEDLDAGERIIKRSSHEVDDEEDRKHLSTPDDERSSDSGFRDKESCEEEESPVPCPPVSSIILSNAISSSGLPANSSPLSASAEEEQMRILFELDTILDAEYYGSFQDSERLDETEILSPSSLHVRIIDSEAVPGKNRSISESLESTESTDVVETVRANSCEPDFLDSRSLREIGSLASPEEEERLRDEELKELGDFLKREGDDDKNLMIETSDDTEADLLGDSTSDSLNTDKNSEYSQGILRNLVKDSSDLSIKNSSRSNDSSAELRRLNVDSSSSGKFDESTDQSFEFRSSDASELNKSKTTDSNDLSLDLRRSSSEICRESSDSTSQSPLKSERIAENSESCEASIQSENSTSDSPLKSSKPHETSGTCEASELENSTSDSPLKTDRNQTSDLSMETRGAESVHSEAEQWSSRENINDNDDEDSSTMSLRSDNSYVSFGLDEEFVAAIRNELCEKLPRAQMPVIEALDPRDEKEPSINKDAETKRWEDEEAEDSAERGSVDISIRYNIYGTPLSPILEERESAGTSESLVSKEDSREDASIASRVSALSEDVLVVDTRTNRAMILEGNATNNGEPSNSQQDEDRDTSHGDFSDEENLEYPQNNLNRGMESKRISMGSGGAPLPSPEEESKWQQQFPLPLQMQDDLMSTSFGTDRDWDSQDEDEGEDEGEEGEEDEEENSSSSGEFVWKRYDESHGDLENVATRSPPNKPKSHEPEADLDEEDEGDEEDEEEEEEFTPSAWDATLAPHRSALRSPEKTLKSGDQKKSVWFKKQRYHCVYEYPKETPVVEGQGQAATTWEPTSYADWEEMMEEPRLDVYPMEYDETNRPGDEEFYVSSSNRPFQFQSGEGKYVSQFFPGASSTLLQQQQPAASEDSQESQDEVDRGEAPASPHLSQTNGNSRAPDFLETQQQLQQTQLGELRHTRDRLKLNLLSTSSSAKTDEDDRAAEIENLQNKAPKTFEITEESSIVEKNILTGEKSIDDEENTVTNVKDSPNESNKMLENAKSIERNARETSESVKSSNLENLAVKDTPEVDINDKQDEKQSLEESHSIDAKNSEVGAAKASRGDDLAVIQSKDEVSSARNDSRSIGDQKSTSESRETSTSEFTVEQIVDIPKLETEESPKIAPESEDKKSHAEATKIEVTSVRDAVSASPTSNSSSEAVKVDEKSGNIVQSSES